MSLSNSVSTKQRFSLTDIDGRLQYISEFAEALGVDPNKIISDILTSLKLKLNSEVKKTSSAKRQRLLEYLFPYAVLDDYSPLVSYLLEHEDNIPDIVMEKLLHDATYSVFLTPSIKVNIYKKRKDYFNEDVHKAIDTISNNIHPGASCFDRCPNNDKGLFQSILLETDDVLSNTSLLQMTGEDPSLRSYLCESLLNFIIDPSHPLDPEKQSQLYKLTFSLIKENHSILFPMSSLNLSPTEENQIGVLIKKLLNTLSTVIDSDRTVSRDTRKQGESDIYDPTTKLLTSVYKEMCIAENKSGHPDGSNVNKTLYNSKRSALFSASIDKMISHDFQHIFSSPVTDAIAPDYKKIIQHPMDLSTMKSKVSQYESIKDIQQDIELIISNSEVYNGKNAPITQVGYELRRQWMRILQQTEEQDKKLKMNYKIETTPSLIPSTSPTTTAKKGLPFLLLITGIAFSTPSFASQLLRAIYQRIHCLCGKQQSPSDSGIVDPILYTYYQFLLLSQHVPDLLDTIRGNSDYFPSSFFDTEHKADSIQEYVQHAMFIFQVTIYGQIEQDLGEVDKEVFDCLSNASYRWLIYSCCASQVCRVNDMGSSVDNSQLFILSNFYKLIMKIPSETLLSEWQWIDAIIAAQVVKRISLNLRLVSLLMEQLLIPCMSNPTLFSVAFKSFFHFLRCLKHCELASDDLVSQISSCISKGNFHKRSVEDLDSITKGMIKESSGTVSDFRVIFLQLLSDYSITSEIPSFTTESTPVELPPVQSEKRESPSFEAPPFQNDSEDDFF